MERTAAIPAYNYPKPRYELTEDGDPVPTKIFLQKGTKATKGFPTRQHQIPRPGNGQRPGGEPRAARDAGVNHLPRARILQLSSASLLPFVAFVTFCKKKMRPGPSVPRLASVKHGASLIRPIRTTRNGASVEGILRERAVAGRNRRWYDVVAVVAFVVPGLFAR